ncbi:MAG: ribonuclease P protein component [Patescibacteria group bacterium]
MSVKIGSLTKDKDFDQVFKRGRSCYCQTIGLKIIANKIGQNRLGIIISRKVSKKAVDRNKLKRRIKEIIRLLIDKLLVGYDILVITLPGAKEKTYQEISKILEQGLNKLKMLK